MTIVVGSVTSGIASCALAVRHAGLEWRHAFFSEIAAFPSAVLAHHYPEIPNLGDFTQITEERAHGISLLMGSTPCQSFSVAGLRRGMDDERGALALEFLRLAARARPRWIVWENVDGALSSWTPADPPSDLVPGREWEAEETSDFGSFLAGLSELGYGWAYRVLDAQHFGLAQRRKRVFVVGYLGDWRPPCAVLLERARLRGDPAPSLTPWEGTSGGAAEGAGGGGGDPTRVVGTLGATGSGGRGHRVGAEEAAAGHIIATPLTTRPYADNAAHEGKLVTTGPLTASGAGRYHAEAAAGGALVANALGASIGGADDNDAQGNRLVVAALKATEGKSGPGLDGAMGGHFVAHALNAKSTQRLDPTVETLVSGTLPSAARAHATVQGAEQGLLVAGTIGTRGDRGGFDGSQGAPESLVVIPFDETQITHAENRSRCEPGSPSPSLARGARPPTIAFNIYPASGQGADLEASPTELSNTITPTALAASTERGTRIVQSGVRRLTVRECERLMGVPVGYTLLPPTAYPPTKFDADEVEEMAAYLGISLEEARAVGATADGPRYAALGNSIAIPCLAWIFKRIDFVDRLKEKTDE